MHLSQSELDALSIEDKERYRALEQLFKTKGWKLVSALASQNAVAQFKNAALAPNWDQNRIAVGQYLAWNSIASLETETEQLYEQKISEATSQVELKIVQDQHDFE